VWAGQLTYSRRIFDQLQADRPRLDRQIPNGRGAFRETMELGRTGGGRGIRTPEPLSGLTVFKTAGFNHSPIPPSAFLGAISALATPLPDYHSFSTPESGRRSACAFDPGTRGTRSRSHGNALGKQVVWLPACRAGKLPKARRSTYTKRLRITQESGGKNRSHVSGLGRCFVWWIIRCRNRRLSNRRILPL
jgi:hypothetical protein